MIKIRFITTMMLAAFISQIVYAQPVQIKKIPEGSYDFFSAFNNLYFFHNDSLWKSDGTTAGTVPLKYVAGQGITPLEEAAFQISNAFFFEVRNGSQYSLWRSNGTPGGTMSIGTYSAISQLDILNDQLIFSATIGGITNLYKVGLGMPQSITVIAPVEGETTNGKLLFNVLKPSGGSELWRTDGTTAGTLKIKDFPDAVITDLENVDGTLFFVYKVLQDELWKSNGTSAGTVMIESHALTVFYGLTAHEGRLYFSGNIDSDGEDLFVTDGTPGAAERLIEDIEHASIYSMKKVGDVLALEITLDGADEVIWRTNGVTEQIYWTIPGYQEFTPVNQHLFFTDEGLWQSDMTEVNTKKVTDIFPGLTINDPANLVGVNDVLYFTTPDGAGYITLWKYNPLVPSQPQPYFTVVNAESDQDKAWLMEGDTIYLYPDETINIRFNPLTNPESVRFVLNGSTFLTENVAPFALAGDNNGNYNIWNAQEGAYSLIARQYSGNNATGTLVATNTIHFYVEKEPIPPVVNAGPDQSLNSISSTTLTGSVSVQEGEVTSVEWSVRSWPSGNTTPVFSNPNSLSTSVTGLSYPGVYTFRLTVYLSNGTSDHDDMQVIVTGQAIETVNLINADTDEIVYSNFGNDHIFYLSHYSTSNFNIMAIPTSPTTGSVRFVFDGKVTVENVSPYAVFGDNNGNYNPGPLTLGTHTLSATPYSGQNATGIQGLTTTITFNVLSSFPPFVDAGPGDRLFLPVSSIVLSGSASDFDGTIASVLWTYISGPLSRVTIDDANSLMPTVSGLTVPGYYVFRLTATDNTGMSASDELTLLVTSETIPMVSHFTLVNADTETDLIDLNTGATIHLDQVTASGFNIRAGTIPGVTGSVRFQFDGTYNRMENQAPYMLFGDNNGDYNPGSISPGMHTLTATPYTGPNGTGSAGTPLTITFTVTGSHARLFSIREESAISAACFPNPSKENFMISFHCTETASGLVEVYHETGKFLLTLFEGNVTEGEEMNLNWNTAGVMPGVYIVKISTGTRTATEKLVLE